MKQADKEYTVCGADLEIHLNKILIFLTTKLLKRKQTIEITCYGVRRTLTEFKVDIYKFSNSFNLKQRVTFGQTSMTDSHQ